MSDRLRIAWFTPFHPHSAIGEFSQHVTSRLAAVADVEIWTSEEQDWLSTELPIVRYEPTGSELGQLESRDVAIYNLGNYLGYHGDIHAVARQHPGIVILHDRALHHLFSDLWLQGDEKNPPRYLERMRAFYGRDGEDAARETLRGERAPVWESDVDVLRYPLYEESIIDAIGVVTHSVMQAREVRDCWFGPVAALNLPSYGTVLADGARPVARDERSPQTADGRLRVLTMGHLNPNKQVHRVIELLKGDPELGSRVEYRVVGSDGGFHSYSEKLRDLAGSGAEARGIELLGWLPDEALEDEIAEADIFINLRHPNIEGGSASLMRQLAYGRPVLCFDSGCFGEVPADAVVRVPVDDFEAARCALRELVEDEDRRRAVGIKAREFAERSSEDAYVAGLMRLVEESRRASPGLAFLDAVGHELGRMGVDTQLPVFNDIANDFARILDI